MYLKESDYGPHSPTYQDFGELGDDFKAWWRRCEHLFSEPALTLPMQDVADLSLLQNVDLNAYMVVVVGLDVAKRTTKRTFARLLDKRKQGLKGGNVFARSKAKYRFATTPIVSALEKTLRVHQARKQGGTLWQIGERANIAQSFHVRRDDARKIASGKKLKMSVTVKRYLKHAEGYLRNVPLGLFPKK
jgi:hypothetical protein